MGCADSDVSLAILAGGRARRLGGIAKGLLRWQGRTLLEHLLSLSPRFAETFLVTADPAPYVSFGVRSVPDVVPGRGAPGGVHAALVHAPTPWVLVVAADMPFITLPVLELLLAECTEAVEAVGFEVAGRLEPLLACYRSALAPRWAVALEAHPSFPEVWQTLRARLLLEEALAEVDPGCRAVRSVNTPEEAKSLSIEMPTR
jgi:molybdopterin-guanine dinucleotide biosynthesis protein A